MVLTAARGEDFGIYPDSVVAEYNTQCPGSVGDSDANPGCLRVPEGIEQGFVADVRDLVHHGGIQVADAPLDREIEFDGGLQAESLRRGAENVGELHIAVHRPQGAYSV